MDGATLSLTFRTVSNSQATRGATTVWCRFNGVNLCHDRSSKNILHDSTVEIGQPEVSALKPVRQSLVIETQQLKYSGLQIVDVGGIAGHRESQFV